MSYQIAKRDIISENLENYRYTSGRQLYTEALRDGRYQPCHRSPYAQTLQENVMNGPLFSEWARELDAEKAFIVELDGREINGNFKFVSFEETDDTSRLHNEGRQFELALYDDEAELKVTVITRLDGSDFIERRLRLENKSGKSAAITGVSPIAGLVWSAPCGGDVLKEGEPAFEVAYSHIMAWGAEGDFYYSPVPANGIKVRGDMGDSGMGRPSVWLKNNINGERFVVEYAYNGNWEINIRATEGWQSRLYLDCGMLRVNGEALWVMKPGEVLETPAVHFGLFRCDEDTIVQALHSYVRHAVAPPTPEGAKKVALECNHRGFMCDRENEEWLRADMEINAAVGVETYIIDAGWYGLGDENHWRKYCGDFYPHKWIPNGMRALSDYAHSLGMKFGLWVAIEAAGECSELFKAHPEWINTRHGVIDESDIKTVDISIPEAYEHCLGEMIRIVGDYNLDLFRTDHGFSGLGGTRIVDGYIENNNWRYHVMWVKMFDELKSRFPRLELQCCHGGGGHLDWCALGIFHNAEMSDTMRQPRDLRILENTLYSLPPEKLLRCFGTECGGVAYDGSAETQFRKAMLSRPTIRGVAPYMEDLSPYLRSLFDKYVKLFKEKIRPMLPECRVYNHTGRHPILEASERTVLEYAAEDGSIDFIVAYTMQTSGTGRMTVYPKGLTLDCDYLVTYDNNGKYYTAKGHELYRGGIALEIPQNMGSEMLIIEKI